MTTRHYPIALLILVTFALGACGSDPAQDKKPSQIDAGTDAGTDAEVTPDPDVEDDSGSPDDVGPGPAAPCTSDPELVASGAACQLDDHCPCGTHCDLGRCAADCTADSECAGDEVCDSFGRCRASGDTTLVPTPGAQSRGLVQVDRVRLVLPADAEASFEVSAGAYDIDRARVVATDGVELECPQDDDFAQECMLTDLAVGQPAVIAVRRPSTYDPTTSDVSVVSIHGPANSETVTLPRPDQANGATSTDDQAEPIGGRYSGVLRLEAAGTDADLDALPDAPIPVAFDVNATVWEVDGETVLAIDDPNGALTSHEQFIGTLSLAADDDADGVVEGAATFETHPFARADVAGREHTLLARSVETALRSKLSPRTLSLTLTQAYDGTGSPVSPAVRWSLELQRHADTAASAPTRDHLPATLGYDAADRLANAPPWSRAFTDAAFPDIAAMESFFDEGDPTAKLCGLGHDNRSELHHVFSGYLMADGDDFGEFSEQSAIRAIYSSAMSSYSSGQVRMNRNYRSAAGSSKNPSPPYWRFASAGLKEGIACSMQNFTVDINGVQASGDVDFCNTLAAKTGCRVQNVNHSQYFQVEATFDFYNELGQPLSHSRDMDVTTTVTKVCDMTPSAPYCGEFISCIDTSLTSGSAYINWDFADRVAGSVGELECAGSARFGGIALDYPSSNLAANDVLSKCQTELDKLDEAPASPGSPNDIFAPQSECIDVGRTLAAIGAQSLSLTPGAAPLAYNNEVRASAYTQRLLGRWLQLHGFIAGETDQTAQMSEYFRQGLNVTASDRVPPTVPEMLATSTAGWDLFMTPHVANAVYRMPVEALVEPDYRHHRYGLNGAADDEQTQVLASIVYQTLTRQSALLERFARLEGPTNDPNLDTDPLTVWMPRMLVAQTMAADMEQRVRATGATPDWQDRFDRRRQRAQSSVLDSLEFVLAVNRGVNPLGITDADLPLYFAADGNDGMAERFSAITDYIAGSLTREGLAGEAVDKASSSLADAEQAYVDLAERGLRDARLEQWRIDLKREYDTKLFDYCGAHLSGGDPDYSPVQDAEFNAGSCAVVDRADCRVDISDYFSKWREVDVIGRMCAHVELVRSSARSGAGFASDAMRTFTNGCYADDMPSSGAVSFGTCSEDPQAHCLRCEWKDDVDEVALSATSLQMASNQWPANANPEAGPPADYSRAMDTCETLHVGMRRSAPAAKNPLEIPGCVQGSIGEAFMDVVAAASDIEGARQAIREHTDAYNIEMRSCFRLAEVNQDVQDARDAHYVTMNDLRFQKIIADGVAEGARAAKECAATMTGAAGGGNKAAYAVAGVSCGLGAAEAAANITSLEFQRDMDDIQQQHEDNVATLQEDAELDRCFIEAGKELVTIETAGMNLDTALFNLERAQGQLEERIAEAARVYQSGFAYFGEASADDQHDASGDLWARAEIQDYVRDFQIAKRTTYLAVRAVEYEYQQSLGVRQDVLDAKLPRDLDAVLGSLWSTAETRKINGSAPNEMTVVVSMRDDIFQLNDESAWPESLHPLSVTQRFRTLLQSERYAVYDDDGVYQGQRIPFEVAPLGALDVQTGGVPIYSETDCAERLWSLDVGIAGEEAAVGDSVIARVDLAQRNTFYSQWCSEPGVDQPAFQYSSVRPSRNLFRAPGVGELDGTSDNGADGVQEFSTARIQATIGTDQATMETQQASSGASTELATRGMYGDYALFIDREFISRDGSDGIDLDKVDDILLRFDYLSVAN